MCPPILGFSQRGQGNLTPLEEHNNVVPLTTISQLVNLVLTLVIEKNALSFAKAVVANQ
jgi:hypothetical protein